jgi:hypothetical protein
VVTTGKYVEYALLAPAVVLLVRRVDDLLLLLLVVVASSVVASTLAVVQFFGWRIAGGWPAGYRQPSFLGHHDFASLSGFALAIALAAIALPAWRIDRRIAVLAGISGVLGLVVSGSLAGAFGLVAAGVRGRHGRPWLGRPGCGDPRDLGRRAGRSRPLPRR